MDSSDLYNYYESLVMSEIDKTLTEGSKTYDPDMLCDVACIALNQLPPRYIRSSIDLAFYMEPDEKIKTEEDVTASVKKAFFIATNKPRPNT